MSRILVVGFGPFPRVPRNPSGVLARRLAAEPRFALSGDTIAALVLPTSYAAIDAVLRPAIARERPDVVLMLGVAARRRSLCIETRAVNRVSRLFPDAQGQVGARLAFSSGAPLILRSRAMTPALLRALRAARLPARCSIDAGRYLCNAAYYAALQDSGRAGALVAFVHVPLPRRDARRDRRPTLAAMAKGLTEVALRLAARSRRLRRPAPTVSICRSRAVRPA